MFARIRTAFKARADRNRCYADDTLRVKAYRLASANLYS